MCCRTSQATLLRPIRTIGIFCMFEIESDFVEPFFRDKIFAVRAEVTTVDEGVNEGVGMRGKVAAGFDAADTFEAKSVPNSARGDISFVDEVEDGVCVTLGTTSTR